MAPNFVLGSKRSSTYPYGRERVWAHLGRVGQTCYASGRFSPAIALDEHFHQPAFLNG